MIVISHLVPHVPGDFRERKYSIGREHGDGIRSVVHPIASCAVDHVLQTNGALVSWVRSEVRPVVVRNRRHEVKYPRRQDRDVGPDRDFTTTTEPHDVGHTARVIVVPDEHDPAFTVVPELIVGLAVPTRDRDHDVRKVHEDQRNVTIPVRVGRHVLGALGTGRTLRAGRALRASGALRSRRTRITFRSLLAGVARVAPVTGAGVDVVAVVRQHRLSVRVRSHAEHGDENEHELLHWLPPVPP